jgi:hypothetical protein
MSLPLDFHPEVEEAKEETFDCLDHCYFETEFEKVLQLIHSAQKEVRFRFGSQSDKAKEVAKNLQELKNAVLDELDFIRHSLSAFDAKYELRVLLKSAEAIEACKRGEPIDFEIEEFPHNIEEANSALDEDAFPPLFIPEAAPVLCLVEEFEITAPKKKKNRNKRKTRDFRIV